MLNGDVELSIYYIIDIKILFTTTPISHELHMYLESDTIKKNSLDIEDSYHIICHRISF